MTKGRGRIESFPALICPQGQSADHHGQLDTRAKPAAVDHSAFSASVVSSTGASAASSTGASSTFSAAAAVDSQGHLTSHNYRLQPPLAFILKRQELQGEIGITQGPGDRKSVV